MEFFFIFFNKEDFFFVKKWFWPDFRDEELGEMVDMLKSVSKNPEIVRKMEEYGPGYDGIYLDGIADAKLDSARKFLAEGVDEEIISECTGISIDDLKKLKENFKTPIFKKVCFFIYSVDARPAFLKMKSHWHRNSSASPNNF